MDILGAALALLGFLGLMLSHLWLIAIIWRGSAMAAILCLFVPFLFLFFIRDHWAEARPAVITWVICLVMVFGGVVLQSAITPTWPIAPPL